MGRPAIPMARRWAALAAIAAVLPLGCTAEPTELDPLATEAAVGGAAADALQFAVVSASCPAELPRGEGEQFTCEVELDDELGTVEVEVTQTDDGGTLAVVPQAAVLDDAEVAELLLAELEETFDRPFLVVCGDDGPRVRAEGDAFNCRARDDGGQRSVRVTVEDGRGTLSFDLGT